MSLNKKLLSERDICTKYITPSIEAAGWNKHTQLLEEVSFTDGKIYVRGKLAARGKGKRADYILYYKPNIPIAIIEAKDNNHSVRAGIQQALEYARILDIPCVFSSNGDGFLFHDRSAGTDFRSLEDFGNLTPSLAANAVPPRAEPTPLVIAEGKPQRHEGSHEGSAEGSPADATFVIAEGKPQHHEGGHEGSAEGSPAVSRFVIAEGKPQHHEGSHEGSAEGSPAVSRFVIAEGKPQHHEGSAEGSPADATFVIAEGKLQRHEGSHEGSAEGSPAVSRFVIAEDNPQRHEGGHEGTTHMTSQSLPRNFGVAYGNDKSGVNETSQVVFDDDKSDVDLTSQSLPRNFGVAYGNDKSDVDMTSQSLPRNFGVAYGNDKSDEYRDIERELSLDEFPSPAALWEKYKRYKGITTTEEERIASQDYYTDGSGRHPRYYQQIAINRTVEAIAKGQNRVMLVMATGTGKTYTAFQIVWRLWKAGVKKRILFLADRNALISQTRRGDFKHFSDVMTVVKNGQVDKSYEIYLALYQGLSVDLTNFQNLSNLGSSEDLTNLQDLSNLALYGNLTPSLAANAVPPRAEPTPLVIAEGKPQRHEGSHDGATHMTSQVAYGNDKSGVDNMAYDQPPLTRRERALNVKKRDYFTKYGEQARRVLEALLDKYADEGIENLESLDVLKVRPLTQFGSPIEILREFGGKERFLAAVRELEGEIYRVA